MKLYREKMAKLKKAQEAVDVPTKVEPVEVKVLPAKKAPKAKKSPRVCSVCKGSGHTKRKCPTLKAPAKEDKIEAEETTEEKPVKKWWQSSTEKGE